MAKRTFLLIAALAILFTAVQAQKKDSLKVKQNHYTLTIGAGWTHYYNNLENGDQKIYQDYPGFSFRFFWEPEHRLSLGLESGYYKLFRVKNQVGSDIEVKVDRVVVPLLLLVRMRIIDNVYLTAGTGLAIITNKASGPNSSVKTKVWSLSNYQFSGSYIYPLSSRWRVGGEFKVYNFGSLDDWMYSVQALCAFRF
jgi:hypothetical protein